MTATGAERYSGRGSGRSEPPAPSLQLSGGATADGRRDLVPAITSTPAAATPPRLPAYLAQLRRQLPARDLAILATLAAVRLATTRQLQRLVVATGSPATRRPRTRRALGRLAALGLVTHPGNRRKGGARPGSADHRWHLTPTGARVAGNPAAGPGRWLRSPDHALATTELAAVLAEAHRAGMCELVHFEAEPACWRSFTADGHRRHLRPDAFAIVAVGEWEHLWFIELDRASQRPHVLRAKAAAYHTYAQTGREQDRWGVFPRVAYLTTGGDPRCDELGRALGETPDADQLVTVAPLDQAVAALTAATDASARGDR